MEQSTNTSGCLPRIKNLYRTLSKAEQKVADYIVENPSQIVNLSITELAEITGNAESTIFRLCKKLGFKGYQSFKIALAGELYTPLESVFKEVTQNDSILTIAQKVFQSIMKSLQDTLKILSQDQLNQAIEAIMKAPRIDVYGLGASAEIAEDVVRQFMHFGTPCMAYSDSHMQIASAALRKPGDVVIAISHSGSNKDLIESVHMAKKAGAIVILITSHLKSPLTQIADIVLCSSAEETNYRSEAMASRIIHLAIIDVLYIGIFLRRQEAVTENIQKIREAIAQKRV